MHPAMHLHQPTRASNGDGDGDDDSDGGNTTGPASRTTSSSQPVTWLHSLPALPLSPLPTPTARQQTRGRKHDTLESDDGFFPIPDAPQMADHKNSNRMRGHHPTSDADLPVLTSETREKSSIGGAPMEDSSVLPSDADTSNAQEDSALFERDMHRKLMDMESSFIPEDQPLPSSDLNEGVRGGADDTYLFGGSPGNGRRRDEKDSGSQLEPETPSEAYKTPAMRREDMPSDDVDGDASTADPTTSSPSAAAARRTHARTTSSTSQSRTAEHMTPDDPPPKVLPTTAIKSQDAARETTMTQEAADMDLDSPAALPSPRSEPSSAHTLREIAHPSERRHTHQISQFSSISALSHQSDLEDGIGSGDDIPNGSNSIDYAVATGGAAPNGTSRSLSSNMSLGMSLSRLPSASSINSFLEDFETDRPRLASRLSILEPLVEHGEVETPRAGSGWVGFREANDPTDTVITQHVKNIHVPETVAREFARKHQQTTYAMSPAKRTGSLAFGARGNSSKSNLTLKEQNSKIDMLSKENFDLKLKIHFLDQALQNRSDEGVKEMIGKNVQLQTDLANEKKDAQTLRRKLRDLERKMKNLEDGQTAQKRTKSTFESDEDGGSGGSRYTELEEEIIYLRECLQQSESQVESLKAETMQRELERRKLAEHIKNMTESQQRRTAESAEPSTAIEESNEMWKDLLQCETARKESAEEDAQKARDDLRLAKQQMAQMQAQIAQMQTQIVATRPGSSGGNTTTNHVRNTYHIIKRHRFSYGHISALHGDEMARSTDDASVAGASPMELTVNGHGAVRPGTSTGESVSMATSATLVEQLKHENAELRRDLGAQTSMLTSRNRERERLQQEIEDLKLHVRRGGADKLGSMAGDSIFERSISRQGQSAQLHAGHGRPQSRMSAVTGMTRVDEDGEFISTAELEKERERWERQLNEVRDELATAKMCNQDMERECNQAIDELEQRDGEIQTLSEERKSWVEDLQSMQTERDQALLDLDEKEEEIKNLRDEAEGIIDNLQDKISAGEEELGRVKVALEARNEDFAVLQNEMRQVSEKILGLEDDMAGKRRQIGVLENEAKGYENEMEELDKRVRELASKNERLEVQLESTQDEISFLREEQEGDKIKIGELEAALAGAEQAYQEEREQVQEKHRQREIVEHKEKGEAQKVVDEINSALSKAREEVRRLRKSLSSKEVEAATCKERLDALEGGLRDALGDITGTRSNFLKVSMDSDGGSGSRSAHALLQDIQELQKTLESSVQDLDNTRGELAEKDRLLRNRDALLETSGLEARRLTDLVERERIARKQERNQFEVASRQHQMLSHTMQSHEAKILELETQRGVDRRKIGQLGDKFREQLVDRNNLLLALWHRLSTLCGTEWSQKHTLVDGHVPSLAVIEKNLPGFKKNVIQAVKEVESLVGNFRSRIRTIETELVSDFKALEHALDKRFKKLDHLERVVADNARLDALGSNFAERRSLRRSTSRHTDCSGENSELARLKSENMRLQAELHIQLQLHSNSTTTPLATTRTNSIADFVGFEGTASGLRSPTGTFGVATAPTLMKGYTTSTLETFAAQQQNAHNGAELQPVANAADSPTISRTYQEKRSTSRQGASSNTVSAPLQPSEARWLHRLKEVERRLKAEREARLLDRSGARKRIQEGQVENEDLRGRLEREQVLRRASAPDRRGQGKSPGMSDVD